MKTVATLFLFLFLSGCASVSVKEVRCDPPPIPPELLEPCEEPQPLLDGRLATVYQTQLADLGPWGRCIRKDDKLIEIVKYRDAFCKKLDEQVKEQANKPWWRF